VVYFNSCSQEFTAKIEGVGKMNPTKKCEAEKFRDEMTLVKFETEE